MSAPQPPLRPDDHTVLIVEDDDSLRRFYTVTLTLAGFRVREASDGLTALRIIDSDPPHLVLLDLDLPVLDGFSVREEIAAQATTRQIPVVIITGQAKKYSARLATDDCILTKPVAADQLVETVHTCLQGSRGPG